MKKGLIKRQEKGLVYYTVRSFEDTGLARLAFSTRAGGISTAAYESLNLSILTKDRLEHVLENRKRFCTVMGIEVASLVGAYQVHGDSIRLVQKTDRGAGSIDPTTVIPDTDALITREKNVTLIAFFADCVPVVFLDPVNKAIGLAHAGWKGTVAKIAAKTVAAMANNYGSAPQDLLAAIGPSIGPCHYQVDKPVIEKVKQAFPREWTDLLKDFDEAGHAQLDLWRANLLQLTEAGVKEDSITLAELCTFCHQDVFFSHRAGMAGRQAAMIMLK